MVATEALSYGAFGSNFVVQPEFPGLTSADS